MITHALVDRFRAAGLTVVEMPGWESRGETDGPFSCDGILLHHDAMGLHNNNVPEYMSQNGVNGSQLWIKYTGEVFILAAGRKWHAGLGGPWRSVPQDGGNSHLIGIETDHIPGQPWYAAMVVAIFAVSRCCVQEYGVDVQQWCCGHREYAPTRKEDPDNFDLDAWRTAIDAPQRIPLDWFDSATASEVRAAVHDGFLIT
jgi:N-acetyl-anhydromuramyl-L-alanine amidase AmpD